MRTSPPIKPLFSRAFSLVEVLVAVALVGIMVFLALPNIVQIKDDSETHLAIARAQALNMAMASLIQARGATDAKAAWTGAANDPAKYQLLAPYLAFAPGSLTDYTPGGYTLAFPATLVPLLPVTLTKGSTVITNY